MFNEEDMTPWFASKRNPSKSGTYLLACPQRGGIWFDEYKKNNWTMTGGWQIGACPSCKWRGLRAEYKE